MNLPHLPDDPSIGHILESRARALAQIPEERVEQQGAEHVFFRLGDSGYALPARSVRGVDPLNGYTPLPGTPPFLVGLVNLRGKLISLIDLRPLLNLDHRPPHPGSLLVLLNSNETEFALLADEVSEIRPEDDQLASATAAARGIPWVRGIDGEMNLVLDPSQLVSDPRLTVDHPDG